MSRATLLACAVLLLAACSEKPQTMGGAVKQDTAAYEGTGMPYTAPGWRPGDKVSWEQQLKTRTQAGQNEYNKVN